MAGFLTKLGRGLGAGLQSFGKDYTEAELAEEDKRRFDEKSAREERRLKMQEDEAARREKQAALELAMKRTEYNNKMLVEQVTKNNFDPAITGKAFSQFGPAGGRQYEYDPERSREIGPDAVAYNIFVNETDSEGNPLVDNTGAIKRKRLAPGTNTLDFQNREEMVGYFSPLMSADYMLASELKKKTAEDTFKVSQEYFEKQMQADNAFYEKYKGTPAGEKFRAEQERAGLENKKIKQQTMEAAAETKQIDAVTEQIGKPGLATDPKNIGATLRSLTGKEVVRTKGEAQQDLETFRVASKKYGDLTSPQQAFWINEVKENPIVRNKFATRVQDVVAGKLDRETFLSEAAKTGLSREFAEEFLDEAMANAEAWEEANPKKKRNLLIRTWDKIFN